MAETTSAQNIERTASATRRGMIILISAAVAFYWGSLYFYVPDPAGLRPGPHRRPGEGGRGALDVRAVAGHRPAAAGHRRRLGGPAQAVHPARVCPLRAGRVDHDQR